MSPTWACFFSWLPQMRPRCKLARVPFARCPSRPAANDSSHDWFHIDRVRNTAVALAKAEGLDASAQATVELAALLHDLKDWKYSGDEDAGPLAAEAWLVEHGADASLAALVKTVVASVGFKTELGGSSPADALSGADRTIFEVVQDADRLDAIGAVGIARCFTFGGAHDRTIYDPAIKPRIGLSKEEYKLGNPTSLNHFYEKLLTLKDRMKTPSGRAMADARHRHMELFLEQFLAECKGER